MTATDTTVSTLLVAIDISKHRHEVLIGIPSKKRHRRLTITNTLDDFQRLVAALAGYDLPVRIGFGEAALADTLGEDTPPDWKESFSAGPVDVDRADPYYRQPGVPGHYAPNRWPDAPEDFGRIWSGYYRTMSRLSADMMRHSALALGLPEDYFADKIDRHIGNLGAMYYPDQDQPPAEGQLRLGAHTDFDTMTILRPDTAPGDCRSGPNPANGHP